MYSYEVFERLLDEKGIRAADVSRATGISTATLSSWKSGKYSPKADKLQLIANYFDVPVKIFEEAKKKKITAVFHKHNAAFERQREEYADWVEHLIGKIVDSLLTDFEWELLGSYRDADPKIQAAVRALLEIDEEGNELDANHASVVAIPAQPDSEPAADYLAPAAAHPDDGAPLEGQMEDAEMVEKSVK